MSETWNLGMIGLGVMGRNMTLNLADHGYSVVGFDRDRAAMNRMTVETGERNIATADSLAEMCQWLEQPRIIMVLVPAGPPVDAVLGDLLPHLAQHDVIVDAGNSYFKDTDRRAAALAERGIHFLGTGVSGGEYGARHGPCIMPGGPQQGYARVGPMLEAIAARFQGEPCVAYLGVGSAGHYVKMVHNGIEYGLMQLIADSYAMLKLAANFDNADLARLYAEWNEGELNGYLMEITAEIFTRIDPQTEQYLIDVILDRAEQKGTGSWTAQDALELQVPDPTIEIAVTMRDVSELKDERLAASRLFSGPALAQAEDRDRFVERLRRATFASMLLIYAQGFAQLRRASEVHGYGLRLEDVARIWRAGCIIRAALVEEIRIACMERPDLPNLLLHPRLAQVVASRQEDLRWAVRTAADRGIAAPALMASLVYFDSYRSPWLPTNLIQAQRDFFGAHRYQRTDQQGTFHTQWVGP
jgi:6-phosphogluconate dehydrogenase